MEVDYSLPGGGGDYYDYCAGRTGGLGASSADYPSWALKANPEAEIKTISKASLSLFSQVNGNFYPFTCFHL